jgi:penicillin-binding protein 2
MQDIHQQRQLILQALFVLGCAALVFRCFQLQILNEDKNADQPQTVYPARGLIFDRYGKQLVNNKATYDIMVTYNLVKNVDTVHLCNLLNISKEEFLRNIRKDWSSGKYNKNKPFPFLRNVSAEVFNRFSEFSYRFPGFEGQLRSVRSYDTHAGAHVLGYISEVTDKQVDSVNYWPGDFLGASGLEQYYEKWLRGAKGYKKVLKDNLGRVRGSYRGGEEDIPAQSGLYLYTTLDMELQEYGELLMKNKRGSIVAIEPETGEILALISSPNYDPGLLTINRDRGQTFNTLRADSSKPLLNRAVLSKYPPGSTFKPLMALIGLQEGVLHSQRGIPCGGGYWNSGRIMGCHGHPPCTDPAKAIQYSCNSYFFQTFREVIDRYGYGTPVAGLNHWVDHLHSFGLGVRLGVDMPNESPGNVPTSGYYNKFYRNSWTSPTIISLGIGQGELETTPLQLANMTAIIANRGHFYIPHLAKEFRVSDDVTDKNLGQTATAEELARFVERHTVNIQPQHFEVVVTGMENVMLAGTGARSQIPGISMCGKTGTVENPHGEDHSTFIAFAPKDNPRIAICVFVENSGFGATYAAPIASLMIEKYINRTIDASRKPVEERIVNANLLNP